MILFQKVQYELARVCDPEALFAYVPRFLNIMYVCMFTKLHRNLLNLIGSCECNTRPLSLAYTCSIPQQVLSIINMYFLTNLDAYV